MDTKVNLALFDFDGTITHKGSFPDFMIYVSGIHKSIRLKILLFIPVYIGYGFGIISVGRFQELLLTFFFKGWEKSYFDELAEKYTKTKLNKIIRPIALEQINNHKQNNDKIVVVSASPDSWIKKWCSEHELDLICSDIVIQNGLITGKFDGECCNGVEKVKRIQERYRIDEYDRIYAYGDSSGDLEMLKLADIAYYRWEKKKY